jgi:glycosyltransferase involved in cell wall biosynthesis
MRGVHPEVISSGGLLRGEDTVEILMATYQAESWCDVQIATIVAQDYDNWRLIIRDDASTDSTRSILRFWRDRFPERIVLLDEENPQNLGVTGNFSALMAASTAPYVMFSSWDDVWYRDKVSGALRGIKEVEQRRGTDCPVLVHTDWRIVDGDLHGKSDSARQQFGLYPERAHSIGSIFLENQAWGCTVIVNRALVKRSGWIPPEATCEDRWLALVALAFGEMYGLPEVSIDWRRHGKNDSELPSDILKTCFAILRAPGSYRKIFQEKVLHSQSIITAFNARFGQELTEQDRAAVTAFLKLQSLGFWARRRAVLTHRILYSSKLRNLGLLTLI